MAEEEIQTLVRQQEQAVCRKDVDAAMAFYAPNVVSFDVVDTLQKLGIDACRKRLESWLIQFPGPFLYQVENLVIVAADSLAFCHSFNHVKGGLATGEKIDMRWRATLCFRKHEGQWQITHEHSSVPFDPESGKALLLLSE
ncbi:hypothetical protein BN8_02899 [Fibrisoma limi BUZ 3]|uniref:SnoaL-like domain-containing protein n=1 Tax=Fibrisoma limi BUZ 3 TaxID=1185876 RepID=I2GIQ2_9BACT|nr:nuclear transport factor 2 family protein [Fibrisoma limi]CCH53777.1 hypothetical protein BN8_02899 [Fibrisoma limi BUZ 3]